MPTQGMAVVYIAGPYRGKDAWEVEQNIRRVEETAFLLAANGFIPLSVHTMYRFFDRTLTDEFWLEATMELMRRCDAVLLVGNHRHSEGSVAEVAEANRLGIRVFETFHALCLYIQELTYDRS